MDPNMKPKARLYSEAFEVNQEPNKTRVVIKTK
jgi:hypothetical protein